jgi:hypothetical protein
LKGLLGGKTSKDFEVCNNLPLDKILNFDTKNRRGTIKMKECVVAQFREHYTGIVFTPKGQFLKGG